MGMIEKLMSRVNRHSMGQKDDRCRTMNGPVGRDSLFQSVFRASGSRIINL